MAQKTPGNCPRCGHHEATYVDWTLAGYATTTQGTIVRLWECTWCRATVPDTDLWGHTPASVSSLDPTP